MYYHNVLETIGHTPLIELRSFSPHPGVQILTKMEGANPSGSIKDRIALKMIEQAEARGLLKEDQYGNEANPAAHYETTGAEIVTDMPDIDVLVAGLGSGGTLTGVGRRLKMHNPAVRIVAAEPVEGHSIQGLRSLKDGFIPPVLDQSLLDSRLLVSSQQAWLRTLQLKEQEGIFAGPSSGAVLDVALRVAVSMKRGKIVIILADGGWKYMSEQNWLTKNNTPIPIIART